MSNPLQETSQAYDPYQQQPYQQMQMQPQLQGQAPPPNDPYYNQGQQQPQPNYGYGQPNYGQGQPNYGQGQPNYGQGQPNYGYQGQPPVQPPQTIVIETQHQCVYVDQLKCGCRSFLCFCFCTPCWLGGICCNGNPCYCWDVDKVCSCGKVIVC